MPTGSAVLLASFALLALLCAAAAWRGTLTVSRQRRELETLRVRVTEIAAMAGGLAHEIKNPLSTIGMNAQLLDESIAELDIDANDRARIARRIGTLTRETERLRGILEDFLDYAGELRLHREHADLGPVVEELADFFHPEADKRGVRLRVETANGASSASVNAHPVRAHIDTHLLKQAILNLMINASQALEQNPEGVPRELIIRVDTGRLDSGPADAPRIHIIDTGPGMTPEQIARAFEPYFTTKVGGTGLGLPTTRRIIEAHGGTLTLDSQEGRGTAFTITLPRPDDPGTQAIDQPPS